jgi:3-hydroxyisobutyrate dehydrogenase
MEAVVGVIGAGAMGSALIERFHLAGAKTLVYDVSPEAMERAKALGSAAGESAAAVAEAADIVDVVVRTDDEVLAATCGPKGALEGMPADKILLLHSTIHPRTTRTVAEAAQVRGVQVADACMVGVPAVVRAGGLTFLLGGSDELVERVTPHLLRAAKQVLHMGTLGSGNTAKIIKNLLTASERLIVHEALRIGEAAGIPYLKALDMFQKTKSPHVIERWEGVFDPSGANSMPAAGTNLYDKDLPLAGKLAHDLGVDVPITDEMVTAGRRLLGG